MSDIKVFDFHYLILRNLAELTGEAGNRRRRRRAFGAMGFAAKAPQRAEWTDCPPHSHDSRPFTGGRIRS